MDLNTIASCGGVGGALSLVPTLLLIVSEVLGMSSGKSNGIVHFGAWMLQKVIKKEHISQEEVLGCLAKIEEATEEPDPVEMEDV